MNKEKFEQAFDEVREDLIMLALKSETSDPMAYGQMLSMICDSMKPRLMKKLFEGEKENGN